MIEKLLSFIHDCLEFWTHRSEIKSNGLEEIVVIEDAYYDAQTEKWIHEP